MSDLFSAAEMSENGSEESPRQKVALTWSFGMLHSLKELPRAPGAGRPEMWLQYVTLCLR